MKPERPPDRSKRVMGTPLRPGSPPGAAEAPQSPAATRADEARRSVEAARAAEAATLERARAGDTQAFRQLVERHRDRAYTLALRIVGSAAEAEEVAQDAFVRAWLALPGFRGEASFSTWLYRIVANRAFDRAASLRRRAALEVNAGAAGLAGDGSAGGAGAGSAGGGLAGLAGGALAADSSAGGGSADQAESTVRSLRLEAMIQSLPPAQRAAITLYYYEDRSVDEVARTLGVPPGTVKTNLSRARQALREGWLRRQRMDGR